MRSNLFGSFIDFYIIWNECLYLKKSRIKNSNYFLNAIFLAVLAKYYILVILKIHSNRFKSIFKTLKLIEIFK